MPSLGRLAAAMRSSSIVTGSANSAAFDLLQARRDQMLVSPLLAGADLAGDADLPRPVKLMSALRASATAQLDRIMLSRFHWLLINAMAGIFLMIFILQVCWHPVLEICVPHTNMEIFLKTLLSISSIVLVYQFLDCQRYQVRVCMRSSGPRLLHLVQSCRPICVRRFVALLHRSKLPASSKDVREPAWSFVHRPNQRPLRKKSSYNLCCHAWVLSRSYSLAHIARCSSWVKPSRAGSRAVARFCFRTATAPLNRRSPWVGMPTIRHPPYPRRHRTPHSSRQRTCSNSSKSWKRVVKKDGSRLSHFFESFSLVTQVSDCNDSTRTMVLQTVLVINMFAHLVPCTRLITHTCLERPPRTTGGTRADAVVVPLTMTTTKQSTKR
jgi:hypothetical protein